MAITINERLNVSTYSIEYNFVNHVAGLSAHLAVVLLYDPDKKKLAELHFYQGRETVSVVEAPDDHVDILLPATLLESVHQTLRGERPLYITFFRTNSNVVNNVWFGTSTKEMVGEEENKRD